MSKGSTPRPCNREKFEKGWQRAFCKHDWRFNGVQWAADDGAGGMQYVCTKCWASKWAGDPPSINIKEFNSIEMDNDGGEAGKAEWATEQCPEGYYWHTDAVSTGDSKASPATLRPK